MRVNLFPRLFLSLYFSDLKFYLFQEVLAVQAIQRTCNPAPWRRQTPWHLALFSSLNSPVLVAAVVAAAAALVVVVVALAAAEALLLAAEFLDLFGLA